MADSQTDILDKTNKNIGRIKRRLDKQVIWPLIRPLYLDYQADYRNSIFLAGTEKSGTTWVSDIINYNNDYRYIFEPFWANKVDICQSFKPQQYLRPDNKQDEYLKPAKAILSGKIRNKWTDKYHKKFIANKRLIKDIRANLFLKWIHLNFPAMPIILLLRHPCAVARSHLRRTHLQLTLESYLSQEKLMQDFLNPFKAEMEAAQTKFEIIIFRWCIQNYVPLKQFKRNDIHIVFYEHFCENPKAEIDDLFSFLGKSYDEKVYKQLKKPSAVSREDSAIISGSDLVNSWRDHISADQIQRTIEILSLFGLDKIYSAASMPNIDGTNHFISKK